MLRSLCGVRQSRVTIALKQFSIENEAMDGKSVAKLARIGNLNPPD